MPRFNVGARAFLKYIPRTTSAFNIAATPLAGFRPLPVARIFQTVPPAVVVTAGVATATGVANDATVTAVSAASAGVIGQIVVKAIPQLLTISTVINPTRGPPPSVSVSAQLASGTGAAYDATLLLVLAPTAGLASATGTANQPTITASSAASAGTVGRIVNSNLLQPLPAVKIYFVAPHENNAQAGVAVGTGTAFGATVSAASAASAGVIANIHSLPTPQPVPSVRVYFVAPHETSVSAGVATGTGSAFDAIVTTASAASAGVIGNVRSPALSQPLQTVRVYFVAPHEGNVSAGAGTGTGSAFDSDPTVAPNTVLASGAGAAFDASITTRSAASAGVIGNIRSLAPAQPLPAVKVYSVAPHESHADVTVASGTGSAFDGDPTVAPNAGAASGTGSAFDATITSVSISGAHYIAGVEAVAQPVPRSRVYFVAPHESNVASGTGSGTGSAGDASISLGPTSGAASATGTAFDATITSRSAAAAGLLGTKNTANIPQPIFPSRVYFVAPHETSVTAGAATGTGSANDTTVSLGPTSPAAAGTGQAFNATVTALSAASAGTFGLVVVLRPIPQPLQAARVYFTAPHETNASAGSATGVGTANNASLDIAPTSGVASGTGAAFDAFPSAASSASAALLFIKKATLPVPLQAVQVFSVAPHETNVFPTAASGTGSANNASISIAPTSGAASGTGSANTPAASVSGTSGVATGTGSSGNPSAAESVNPSAASGTGQANDATVTASGSASPALLFIKSAASPFVLPAVRVSFVAPHETNVSASVASGTGTANNASISIAPNTVLATGAGTANDATVSSSSSASAALLFIKSVATPQPIQPPRVLFVAPHETNAFPTAAQGTGVANDTSTSVAPNIAAASGTGSAGGIAASISGTSGVATGTGSGNAPSPSEFVNPSLASGTGQAFNATVTTVSSASAGTIGFIVAKAISQQIATVQVFSVAPHETNVFPTVATGTGSASNASISVATNSSAASGAGTANGVAASVSGSSGTASGTGSSNNPSPSESVNPSAASGTGAAYDATVSTSAAASAGIFGLIVARPIPQTVQAARIYFVAPHETNVFPTVATGTGTANNASINIAPTSGSASGTGTAGNAAGSVTGTSGSASGTGSTGDPSSAESVNAGAGAGTGAAFDTTTNQTSIYKVITVTSRALPQPLQVAQVFSVAPHETNVFPTVATGTGSANNASISVATNSSAASGTGSANGIAASVSGTSSTATGTGSSNSPSPADAVNATSAPATGTANNATVTTSSAASAGVFGFIVGRSIPQIVQTARIYFTAPHETSVFPAAASGTGVANNPTASIAPTSGTAAGTGASNNAAGSVAGSSGAATGTGSTGDPAASEAVNANAASATGAAFDTTTNQTSIYKIVAIVSRAQPQPLPSVQVFSVAPHETNVFPTTATGAGTANNISASIAPTSNVASGTGTANTPAASVSGTSSTATGTGSSNNPAPAESVNPTTATGTGTSNSISASVSTNTSAASGTGQAFDATVTTNSGASAAMLRIVSAAIPQALPATKVYFVAPHETTVNATAATGTGTANNATTNVAPTSTLASSSGSAGNAAASISGSSGSASGSGTDNSPAPSVAVNAGLASGTGSAFDTTNTAAGVASPALLFIKSVTPPGLTVQQVKVYPAQPHETSVFPTVATGTGTSNNASVNIAPNATQGSGTGSANTSAASISGTSGVATGTGSSGNPAPAESVNPTSGSGTGVAFNATVTATSVASPGVFGFIVNKIPPGLPRQTVNILFVAPHEASATAGTASGTGTANSAAASVSGTSGAAGGTGTGNGPAPSVASQSGAASGTGATGAPTPSVAVNAGLATGSGTANNATVTTANFTTATPTAATGTAQAFNTSVSIAPNSGSAAGSALAQNASASLQVQPNVSSGTASAFNGSGTVVLSASTATATGTSHGAAGDITGTTGSATGTGQAGDPAGTLNTQSGIATGTGVAGAPLPAVSVHAGASGTGQANGATVNTTTDQFINAGAASATGQAFNTAAFTDSAQHDSPLHAIPENDGETHAELIGSVTTVEITGSILTVELVNDGLTTLEVIDSGQSGVQAAANLRYVVVLSDGKNHVDVDGRMV